MASVNKVTILGTLGRDPEVRHTQDGRKIVNLSVATSESWKDKASGERKEKTEWHRVVIFNEGLADVAERFLTKGKQVYLEGALQTRKWQDQAGQERYSTEIVLQKFRGELVLLGGGRNGTSEGGSPDEHGRSDDRRSGAAANGHSKDVARNGGYAGKRNTKQEFPEEDDLSDSIPF